MFIYVMTQKDKEQLEGLGYKLLKVKEGNNKPTIWVFKNKNNHNFDDLGVPCVVTDTLTF